MYLTDLFPQAALDADAARLITIGITEDSRKVRPGFVFAALRGANADGVAYVEAACRAGAQAVLVASEDAERAAAAVPEHLRRKVRIVSDPLPRRAMAWAAAKFVDHGPAMVAAVTGTNGKTSVATFTRQIWEACGMPAAALGTLGVDAGARGRMDIEYGLTTPDPSTLVETLATLTRDHGIDHAIMEASSHALHQYRFEGVAVAVAAFTNLSQDHLDYHGTMEAYFAAKRRLFEEVLREGGTAVVNLDDAYGAAVAATARARPARLIGVGAAGDADIRLLGRRIDGPRQHLSLSVFGNKVEAVLPLPGAFQTWNALVALGIAIASGIGEQAALDALGGLTGVRGRLEQAGERGDGAAVFVDYAHTPDALEKALETLRPHVAKGARLHVLFGAGGDRDTTKRAKMGAVAARLADAAVVTDDNPRTEDPESIRAMIMEACPEARNIGDRRTAIKEAIAALGAGDILLIAGKGHEDYQEVKNTEGAGAKTIKLPFDDVAEAKAALG